MSSTAYFSTSDLNFDQGFRGQIAWCASMVTAHARQVGLIAEHEIVDGLFPYLNALDLLHELVVRYVVPALPYPLAAAVRHRGTSINPIRLQRSLCCEADLAAVDQGAFGSVTVRAGDALTVAGDLFPHRPPGWLCVYNLVSGDPTVRPSFTAKNHRRRVAALVDALDGSPEELTLAAELLAAYQREAYGPQRTRTAARGTGAELARTALFTARKAMR